MLRTDDGINLGIEQMDTSVDVTCQRCGLITPRELNVYRTCGHRTCDECHEAEETDLGCDSNGNSLFNSQCPVCQRQALFRSTRLNQPFPPFFRRFDIIRNIQDRQSPALCGECSDDCLRSGATSRCLDCSVYLCESCADVHRYIVGRHRIFTLTELREGNIFQEFRLIPRVDPTLCESHPGIRFTHWCEHCDCPICRQCLRQHGDHSVTPLIQRLSDMQTEVIKLKESVQRFIHEFAQLTQKYERKKRLVQDHFEYLTASIRSAADERKRKIDDDAEKLLKQVDTIKEDYELKCNMVEEMIEREDVANHAWNHLLDSIFQDGDDLPDDKLIDCFQFLKANENLVREQIETIAEISKSAPKLSEIRNCLFSENMKTFTSDTENSVGAIDTPILLLIDEVAEEGGIWVIVGDRGQRVSRNQKNLVIPHFLTLDSKECSLYSQQHARKVSFCFKRFSTIT